MCGVHTTFASRAADRCASPTARARRRRRPPCRAVRPRSAVDQRARLDQPGPAGVHQQRRRVSSAPGRAAVTMPRVASTRRRCSETTSDVSNSSASLLAATRSRRRPRAVSDARRPQTCDAHPERPAVAGHDLADPPVAVDPERLAAQRASDAHLPRAGAQRRHLLRDLAHGGQHQAPRQLGRRVRRRAGVEVRRHDDAEAGAGLDVDVRVDAALADQPQLGRRSSNGAARSPCARG